MKGKWLFIVICLVAAAPLFAQIKNSGSPFSSCGTDGWYENARKDTSFARKERLTNEQIRNRIEQKQSLTSGMGLLKA